MTPSHLLWAVVLLLLCGAVAAQDPDDDATCKDHPALRRLPGFYIDSCENQDFGAHEFPVGDGKQSSAEGKKTQIKYVMKDGARKVSELQVLRNYVNAVQQAGGSVVWSDERSGRGTMRFRAGGQETWVGIRAYDQGEAYDLVFIDRQAMTQEVTAAEMFAALSRDGHIALNIQFDTAQAVIKPESIPIVEQMAALLAANPGLSVTVEGHTDSVGSPASNQTLSEQRAKAVVAAVVGRGISAGRMTAAGYGMTRPMADNSTDEGRARNRRVELVKK